MKICRIALALILVFGTLTPALANPPKKGKKPKNIILMIGDGTGLAQLCATYAANGFMLDIFSLAEVIGLSNTCSADDFITDSAAGATAFSIGEKTKNGMLGVMRDTVTRENICETFHKKGKSNGLVVTCTITHATPAAFFAHHPNRDSNFQIASYFYNGPIDVAMGGGFQYFDSTRLVKNGYSVSSGTQNIYTNKQPKQVGFYNYNAQLPRMSEGRGDYLPKATIHAIDVLSKNKKGFFLMIEGSQIDWGGHNNDSNYVITETLDFNAAARNAIEWAKADGNTLVVITADHECGGLTLTDYDTVHQKPVMHFSTKHHTGIMVPVFAIGPGAEQFGGVYQNTDIYKKMIGLTK